MNTLTREFGRFEDYTPQQMLDLVDWLIEGFEGDAATRFDGYKGAEAGLRCAKAFIVLGDCPEANAAAMAEMGVFADYALDSLYWTSDGEPLVVIPDGAQELWQPTVKALLAVSHLSKPMREALNR